jgi:hypothetical protein
MSCSTSLTLTSKRPFANKKFKPGELAQAPQGGQQQLIAKMAVPLNPRPEFLA